MPLGRHGTLFFNGVAVVLVHIPFEALNFDDFAFFSLQFHSFFSDLWELMVKKVGGVGDQLLGGFCSRSFGFLGIGKLLHQSLNHLLQPPLERLDCRLEANRPRSGYVACDEVSQV